MIAELILGYWKKSHFHMRFDHNCENLCEFNYIFLSLILLPGDIK